MQTSRRYLFFVFTLLLVCVTAYGQGTTSSLSGLVTSDGNPLPGVTVTVSSPGLQGTRTAVTGSGGGYTFPALPPGTYTVRFELSGMQSMTRSVQLTLAQSSAVDAQMRVGGITESITVTASAPAVLESSQVGTNFNQEAISKLPIARNIRQTVLLAPGVSANGVNNQITISGAPSYDNVFLVNGVVVNENLRGQPHNLFIEDAIQETTVMTAGISAEYGRFTGGVVSTLTKSGGNEFSGSFRDSLSNPKWTAQIKEPNPTTRILFAKGTDVTNQVYEATLGGRVIRDRLWFFAAGRKAKTSVQLSTVNTGISFINGFDEKRYEGKLTAQITSRHNIVGSYLDVKNVESNNVFPPIYDEASIVPSRGLPNKLSTVSYNGVLTNNLLAEASWSAKDFTFMSSGGRFTDRIKGTWISDQLTGARMNAPVFCGVCEDEERNSSGIAAKLSYFLSTRSLGNHTIAAGADQFWETRLSNNHQSGSDFTISARVITVGDKAFPSFGPGTNLSWQPIFVLSPGTELRSDALFINDRWELNNHLSFNVGVRYDVNDAVDADGNTVSDDSNISPRLGLTWDIRGDGRHRVTASAARYVAKITDGSNVTSTQQAAGNPGNFTYAYLGPVVNPAGTAPADLKTAAQALEILFAWYDSIGGTKSTAFFTSSYPGFSNRFPESLLSPSTDEISIGYGTQISNNAYARLDVVRREWHNFYAAQLDNPVLQKITPPNGVVADLNFTVNDDEFTERNYTGVTLQGGWNPGRVNLGGNYTWSKLRGNDVSEGAGTATIRNTPGELFYPQYLSYAQRRPVGFLNQDRRNRLRVWAGYDFVTPLGTINVSAIESYDSGFAYSAIGQIDATGRTTFGYAGVPTNPGYILSAAGNSHDYFFSERGAFRTESRLVTDLALNYSLPIFGKFSFFARGDVLNIFDKQVLVDPGAGLLDTSINTRRTTAATSGLVTFNPFTTTPIECPAAASTAAADVAAAAAVCSGMGAHWQKGPNFGKVLASGGWQVSDRSLAPRTYRLSLGFRF